MFSVDVSNDCVTDIVTGGALAQSFTWQQIVPNNGVSPPARAHHAMGYFSRIPVMVIFGGYGGNDTVLGDTWAFDFNNKTWQQVYYCENLHTCV